MAPTKSCRGCEAMIINRISSDGAIINRGHSVEFRKRLGELVKKRGIKESDNLVG